MSLTFHPVHRGERGSVETRLLFRFPLCLPSSPLSGSYHGITPFTTYYNLYNTTFVKVCKYYTTKYLFVKSLYSFGTLVWYFGNTSPFFAGGRAANVCLCFVIASHTPPPCHCEELCDEAISRNAYHWDCHALLPKGSQ